MYVFKVYRISRGWSILYAFIAYIPGLCTGSARGWDVIDTSAVQRLLPPPRYGLSFGSSGRAIRASRVPRIHLFLRLVWKGSVALDGISLTVASLNDRVLGVTIVPHTYENTALRGKRPGDGVNVECDVLAKYVEKLMERVERGPMGLTVDRLKELGY